MVRQISKMYKVVALLIAALMVLSACGGATEATPTTGTTTGEATATVATGTGDATATTGGTTGEATATSGSTTGEATATTGSTSGNGSGPTLKDPTTIVEATIGDPQTLDPAWAYDSGSSEIIFNVYETLLFPKKDSLTEFVPLLAEKMPDVSADGKTYTWQIRKGIKFQDGGDLTPEDVAYSFWRGMIQDRAGGPQWILLQPFFGLSVGTFKDDVVDKMNGGDFAKGCEAVKQTVTFDNNAGTVTMHLAQPYGPMLQILTGSWASIVDKEWSAQQGDWNGDCATAEASHDPKAEDSKLFNKMNGTGPFKLDRWAPGEQIALSRNDNYWQKTPLWDGAPTGPAAAQHVLIKNISEWGTRFAALQAGDVDIAYVDRQYISQVDPLVAETCTADSPCTATNAGGYIRMYKNLPTVSDDTILFNEKVNTTGGSNHIGSGALDGKGIPPDFFSDVHIRKAFSYCFDYQTYIDQVWNGEAQQAFGPIINGVLGYDANQAHYTFDLDKCASEFKAATLTGASGGSVWDTGFSMQYVYNDGNDQRKTAGDILKDGLQRVNPKFQIEVVSEPWPSFLQETTDGTLGLFMLGWQQDFGDPHNWVQPYMSSAGAYASAQNFPADLQKQIDDLIVKAVSSTDENERATMYKQLQNIAYENALDIFLDQPQGRHYEQSWLKGWYYNPGFGTNIYFYSLSKGK
jgi:peptide/nickel transport system substrate-binding protein